MYHIVIPARFGSTRLPGKALADIAGHPMVYWVWQRAQACQAASVVVATDHEGIAAIMRDYGADVAMTRADHPSGTDRLAEVAEQRGWADDTVIVNLQGDEPLMPAVNVEQVAAALAANPGASIATLSEPLASGADLDNPAVVKVVASASGRALYFSRAPIPYPRSGALDDSARRHIGLYAYRCGFLRRYTQWAPAPLERLESLEQLRALHHDEWIQVEQAKAPVPAGVDTPEDLEAVRRILGAD